MEEITRKSMLYKTDVEYGNYTMNYVQGCYHGCKYPCYAMQIAKRFGKIKNYDEWIQPKIVSNTLDILNKELPKLKDKIEFVNLCFTTDPFMTGYPAITKLTLEVMKKINNYHIPVEILTKGIIPDEIVEYSFHKKNMIGISLVSLDEGFRKKFEPYTAKYSERIESLKKCKKQGLKTWVSIEPYPTPNIIHQNLIDILKEIDFVDYIVFGKWNYNRKVTNYKNKDSFYIEQVKLITRFCEEKNIKLHIKKGTI